MGMAEVVSAMGANAKRVGTAAFLSDALGESEFGSGLGRAVRGAIAGGLFGAVIPAVGKAEGAAMEFVGATGKLSEAVTKLGTRGAAVAIFNTLSPEEEGVYGLRDVHNWLLSFQLLTGRGMGASKNMASGLSPMIPRRANAGAASTPVAPTSQSGQQQLF